MSPPRPADLRLVPAATAVWAGAAVAPGTSPVRAALVAVALAVIGPLVLLRHRGPRAVTAVVVLVCVAAGTGASAARGAAVANGPLSNLARQGSFVTLDAVLTGDPRAHSVAGGGPGFERSLVLVRARASLVQSAGRLTVIRQPVLLLGSGAAWRPLLPSQPVRVSGRLSVPQDPWTTAAVLHTRGPPRLLGAPTALQRGAGRLRAGLRDAVGGLPPPERGLVPGLVVGDTSRMPPDVEQGFRDAGLSHLTAVSGANVAIVIALVVGVARWMGARGVMVTVLALLGVAGFVVLCRPEPSVLRATVMGAIALVALASGRQRAGVPALAAAVVLLVLVDPALSRSLGFALSVGATAGILLLAPALTSWLRHRRVPRPLADALAVTVAAQAATGPLLAAVVAQVSLVAVPANLLAAPAVAPATVLGLAAAVAAPVSETLAGLAGRLAGVPAWWIVSVADAAAGLPGSSVPWPAGLWGGAAFLVVTVLASLFVVQAARRPPVGAAAVVVVVVLTGVHAVAPGWPPRGWLMVACDVGQGDALVLAAGPGSGVVVDVGPSPRLVHHCLRDLGVQRVPLVVLTHPHDDHVAGLPGVLKGRSVGEIQVTGEQDMSDPRIAGWARADGVPVTRAYAGERRRLGALTWTVIWPDGPVPSEGSVENNASVVLAVRSSGVRLLLTGDVEPDAQRALLATSAPLRADVLKVPHHGSRFQLPEFLDRVDPAVAVVSAGVDNDYGHPAPTTLRALSSSGAALGRTDRHGDVAVVGPRDSLRVVARGTMVRDHTVAGSASTGSLCHASGRECARPTADPGDRHRPGGAPRRPCRGGPSRSGPRASSRRGFRACVGGRAAAWRVGRPREPVALRRGEGRGPP